MSRLIFLLALALWGFLFPQTSYALTVSPPVLEFAVKPGDTIIDVVRLYNEENTAVTVYPSLLNAKDSGDELGTPQFYSANEDPTGEALARWITTEREPIVLPPGEFYSQPFTINVPANAQPGGHYGAIAFSTVPPKRGGSVGVGAEIAALLLVDVAGTKQEKGILAEFSPLHAQSWYDQMPDGFLVRFENAGTTFVKPVGGITVTNMLGMPVSYLPLNTNGGNVLPRTIRKFTVEGPGTYKGETSSLSSEITNFGFGRYTATLALAYGEGKNVLEETYVFYVWPWRALSVGGFFVLVLGLLLFVFLRRRRMRPIPLQI